MIRAGRSSNWPRTSCRPRQRKIMRGVRLFRETKERRHERCLSKAFTIAVFTNAWAPIKTGILGRRNKYLDDALYFSFTPFKDRVVVRGVFSEITVKTHQVRRVCLLGPGSALMPSISSYRVQLRPRRKNFRAIERLLKAYKCRCQC